MGSGSWQQLLEGTCSCCPTPPAPRLPQTRSDGLGRTAAWLGLWGFVSGAEGLLLAFGQTSRRTLLPPKSLHISLVRSLAGAPWLQAAARTGSRLAAAWLLAKHPHGIFPDLPRAGSMLVFSLLAMNRVLCRACMNIQRVSLQRQPLMSA